MKDKYDHKEKDKDKKINTMQIHNTIPMKKTNVPFPPPFQPSFGCDFDKMIFSLLELKNLKVLCCVVGILVCIS